MAADNSPGLEPLWSPTEGALARRPASFTELLPGDAAPMPEDDDWVPMRIPSFAVPGVPSYVADHDGKLLMLGSFESFGRTRALGALLWDGSTFERLGSPTYRKFVQALDWNGSLYASRGFSTSSVHPEVLKWNGGDWDTVATANGDVTGMGLHAGGLVVVGGFTKIGGVTANHAAFFDGANWHAMGTGIAASLSTSRYRVLSVGSEVYVHVITVGSGPIYRFDGTTWTSTIASTLNGSVQDIATDGAMLYAAGSFSKAGADSCPGIARWDGSAWHRVGVGTTTASAITWWNGQLVADVIDGTSRVSAFDGTFWHGLGDAMGVSVSGLYACGNRLAALARYRPLSGAWADLRTYDGTGWTNVADSWGPDMVGTGGYLRSATIAQNRLVVCGVLNTSANASAAIPSLNVGAWDGSTWSALGAVGGQPMFAGTWGADPVITGSGTITGSKFARWNGSSWTAPTNNSSALGEFIWGTATFQDSLYAATDGPVSTLNGATWSTVGSGGGTNASTYALLAWNGRLVATGSFTTASGLPMARIAAWDGAQWQALGTGLDERGIALYAYGGDLLVGGGFTTAGGQPAVGVARWDGSAWSAMGTKARFIRDFTAIDGTLYAVGVFAREDASTVNTVARWTGTDWQLLGSGVAYPGSVYSQDPFDVLSLNWVEGYQGDLYTGGFLSFAFGQVTAGLIRLPMANTVSVADSKRLPTISLAASPNPALGRTTFSFTLPTAGRARLTIHDIAGREITRLLDGHVLAGPHDVRWESPAAPGVYFATLEAPGGARQVARIVRLE